MEGVIFQNNENHKQIQQETRSVNRLKETSNWRSEICQCYMIAFSKVWSAPALTAHATPPRCAMLGRGLGVMYSRRFAQSSQRCVLGDYPDPSLITSANFVTEVPSELYCRQTDTQKKYSARAACNSRCSKKKSKNARKYKQHSKSTLKKVRNMFTKC